RRQRQRQPAHPAPGWRRAEHGQPAATPARPHRAGGRRRRGVERRNRCPWRAALRHRQRRTGRCDHHRMSSPAVPEFDGKAFVSGLSTAPGVYRMYAADGSLLYVGKAGALKRRVASYFSNAPRSPRIQAMVAQIARMEVTVTRTEAEALLL